MLALTLFRLAAFGMDWNDTSTTGTPGCGPNQPYDKDLQRVQVRPRPPGPRPQKGELLRSAAHGWLWTMPPYRLVVRADPDFPRRHLGRKLLSAAAADEEAAAAPPGHGAEAYFMIVASMAVTTRLQASSAMPVCSHVPFDAPHQPRPCELLSRQTHCSCGRGGEPDQ